MKKLAILALALALALPCAACGGDTPAETPQTPADPGAAASSVPADDAPLARPDPSAPALDVPVTPDVPAAAFDPDVPLGEQMEKINRNDLTAEQVAEIEAEAEKEGLGLTWADDGSAVIQDGDSTIDTSSGWPDNAFTALIPVPAAGEATTHQISGENCAVVMAWMAEDAKAYAAQLRDAGFDQNVDEQDMAAYSAYLYAAQNADGATVTVSCAGGINIEK